MQHFLIALLICSITMSAIALLYKSASPFLAKRYSEKGRYYAWLIIVLGLIIPFRPQWGNAIINVVIPDMPTPIIQADNDMGGVVAEQFLAPTATPSIAAYPIYTPALNINWWQIGFAAWLTGAILLLGYQAIKHYRFIKMARRWREAVKDREILSSLQSIKSGLGITRQIPLFLCPLVGSPMLVGLIKPRIFLPTTNLAQDELFFILKHELIHYKRKDLLYKYLVLIATAMHWFNPLVYLIAKDIKVLCEMSCDAKVVLGTDIAKRQSYSKTIIGVARYQSKLSTALSTNFYGGKKGMKQRILSIMDTSKKSVGAAILCAIMILTMGTGFAFAVSANTSHAAEGSNAVTARVLASGLTIFSTSEATDQLGLFFDPETNHLYFNGELVEVFEGIEQLVGVVFDPETNHLYINDELVQSFEDAELVRIFDDSVILAPTHAQSQSGTFTFTRYLTGVGSVDPSDILLELEGMSQVVFHESNGEEHLVNVRGIHGDSEYALVISRHTGLETTLQVNSDGIVLFSATDNEAAGTTLAEWFADIEEFGVTFSGNIFNGEGGNIYYQGQLVSSLVDDTTERALWFSSSERSGGINIRILRNESGYITGVEVLQQ